MIALALIPLAPVVLVLVRSGHLSCMSPLSRLFAVSAHHNAQAREVKDGEEDLFPFVGSFQGFILIVNS